MRSIPVKDTIYVSIPVISCCGTSEASGHPIVYLRVDDEGGVTCPYCSRQFVYVAEQE